MKIGSMFVVSILIIGLCLMKKETQHRLQYQVGNQVAQDDGSWQYKILIGIGNDAPSPEILNFMTAWNRAEGGTAQFNPLNTTQPWEGATDYNGVHVKNYRSSEEGIAATVATLENGLHEQIRTSLLNNDVHGAIAGLALGAWGTDSGLVSSIYDSMPVPVSTESHPMLQGIDAQRAALVAYALTLEGDPYRTGGGSARFRMGERDGSGDCSSTMQHIYMHVLGIDIGTSTFTQFTQGHRVLRPIDVSALQPGDLWYGRYPDDEHTGMIVGDVTGDGTMDLIDQGGKKSYMGVNNDFLHDPYFMDHLVGFATALEQ